MAASSSSLLSSPPPLLSLVLKRKPPHRINAHHSFSQIFRYQSTQMWNSRYSSSSLVDLKPIRNWRFTVVNGNYLLSEVTVEETLPARDDGVSTVVSALLFVAFVGLAILTIGVIYIAVTDFLQKREREKFEKEEAGKRRKKTKKKSGKIRAGSGAKPRGFGQKIEEFEDEDDEE